jgi:hypothetical protein
MKTVSILSRRIVRSAVQALAAVVPIALAAWPATLTAQQPPVASSPASGLQAEALARSQIKPVLQQIVPDTADLSGAPAALRQAVKRMLVNRAVVDPQSTTAEAAPQHQLTVVAEKGEVNGRARFYIPVNDHSDWIVTLTGPLSAGNATFANETGLGRNVSVNAAFKISLWSYTDSPDHGQTVSNQAGRAYLRGLNTGLSLNPAAVAEGLEALRRLAAATGGLRVVPPDSIESGTGQAQLATGLAQANQARLLRILSSPSIVNSPDRFWAAIAQDPTIVKTTWSGYLTPGYESSRTSGQYLTANTFEEQDFDRRTSLFTLSGGVSRIATVKTPGGTADETTNTPLFFAGMSFRAGSGLTVPDSRNICVSRTAGATECLDLPVGVPTKSTFRSLTVEYRHWELNRSLGVNPRYTYTRQQPDDVANPTPSVTHTFEVPLYFMHKVDDVNNRSFDFGSDLIGGVNLGWRKTSASEGPFVTLFLTKAFGLP